MRVARRQHSKQIPDQPTPEARVGDCGRHYRGAVNCLNSGNWRRGDEAGVLQRLEAQIARFGVLPEPCGAQINGVAEGGHGLLRFAQNTLRAARSYQTSGDSGFSLVSLSSAVSNFW